MKNHYSLSHVPHQEDTHNSTHKLLPHPETLHFILSFAAAYWTSRSLGKEFYVVDKIMN